MLVTATCQSAFATIRLNGSFDDVLLHCIQATFGFPLSAKRVLGLARVKMAVRWQFLRKYCTSIRADDGRRYPSIPFYVFTLYTQSMLEEVFIGVDEGFGYNYAGGGHLICREPIHTLLQCHLLQRYKGEGWRTVFTSCPNGKSLRQAPRYYAGISSLIEGCRVSVT